MKAVKEMDEPKIWPFNKNTKANLFSTHLRKAHRNGTSPLERLFMQHSEPKPEALNLKRQYQCETPLNEIVSVPSPNATKVKAIDTRPSMLTESSEQAFTEAQFQHTLSNTDLL